MAVVWIKTNFLGVRYREHGTRRHGVKPDRCFSIRYKVDGKDKEEVVGWASEEMSAEKAFKILSTIRDNIKKGTGAKSLAEIREENELKAGIIEKESRAKAKAEITFSEFWVTEYWPAQSLKTTVTREAEDAYYRKWLFPAFGNIPLRRIDVAKLEALVTRLVNDGKAPGTIVKILGLVRQVWNYAVARDVLDLPCPVRRVKVPRKDAARQRFLTPEEATMLLQALRKRSLDMHDEALLALFCGMRAGEIYNLTVADCNLATKTILLRDTKSGKNRHAYMTPEVDEMLIRRMRDKGPQELLFPAEGGKVRRWVSSTFDRVVTELGFNKGISDPRQKLVFHSLRHTFASWLVQRGTPLYEVAKLMGHSTIRMTERYSHLAPDTVRRAALGLGGILDKKQGKIVAFRKRA